MIGRFVFMVLVVATGAATFVTFTSYLSFSGREGGTVFQQLVVMLEFALSALMFLVSTGFFAILSMLDGGQKRVLSAVRESSGRK